MPNSADCINTQSLLGRNLTPLPIIEAARKVLGSIDVDFCTDAVANEGIQAKTAYDFFDDGYQALCLSDHYPGQVWLNPPGVSYTGGSREERAEIYRLVAKLREAETVRDLYSIHAAKEALATFRKQHPWIERITAADWYEKFFEAWVAIRFNEGIFLVYRANSLASLDQEMLDCSVLCHTCKGASSPILRSGRIAFETVEDGERVPQPNNTGGSVIGFLGDEEKRDLFREHFSQFGVVKQ